MRGSWRTLLLGVVACSGDPFARQRGSAGAGGHSSLAGAAGTTTTPSVASGAGGQEPIPDSAAGGRLDGVSGTAPAAGAGGQGPIPDNAAGGRLDGISGAAPAAGKGGDASGTPMGDAGAPAGPECPARVGGDWALGFFPELRDATTQESHPFFRIDNLGASPTTLDRISIRYYFTQELNTAETTVCFWVTGDACSLAEMSFYDLPQPAPNASHYLEVAFPAASNVMVFPGTFEVRVGFNTGGAPMLQMNDYSFDPNANSPTATEPFPYKRWAQTTLYIDGELVWGKEPCSSPRAL